MIEGTEVNEQRVKMGLSEPPIFFVGQWYVRTGDNLFVDISKLQLGGVDVEIFPCLHFQRVLQEHICKRVRSSG